MTKPPKPLKEKPIAMPKVELHSCLYNPASNADVISLIRQPDGNWKGFMQRFGTLVEVRQISPMAVLEYLLVHDGKVI